jgi:hypothetical protein
MIFYDQFYRKYGLRKMQQFLSPALPSTQYLELPQHSLYHYLPSGPLDVGPTADEYLFRHIKKPILVDHTLVIGDLKGYPKRQSVNTNGLVRGWHTKHRRYVQMKSLTAFESQNLVMVVENYGFLPQLYKYPRNAFSAYWSWYNIEAALWKRVAELSTQTERHQFIKVQLPTTLPSLADLRKAATANGGKLSAQSIRALHEPANYFLLELWKWLGEFRQDSLLKAIPEEKLDRINLIFQESGRWTCINLGVVNGWRATPKTEVEALEKAGKKPNREGMDVRQMERMFMKLMMVLFEVRSSKHTHETAVPESQPGAVDEAHLHVTKPEIASANPEDPSAHLPAAVQEDILNVSDEHAEADAGKDWVINPELEHRIDAELAELERISEQVVKRREELEVELVEDPVQDEYNHLDAVTVGAAPSVFKPTPVKKVKDLTPIDAPAVEDHAVVVDHNAGIKKVLDRLADQGMLSAAEVKRFTELGATHEKIVAPDGTSTLKEFVKIDPEKIAIKQAPQLPDIKTVVDKTMLKSSLIDFDSRYIKDVMHRDVAAMVMSIQNAGICVTDYEVERVQEITGAYDAYTIRATPIEGAPSTLRWKLPVVDPDGTYESNGVKYTMRKQRGDLPIRKIDPSTVALTSYYGKLMVSRSEKKVNDWGSWLRNGVMAAGLDDENTLVPSIQPSNVFDAGFICPKLYSTLAMGFREITVKPQVLPQGVRALEFTLILDHTKRETNFDKAAMATYEKNGALLVGVTAGGKGYIVMDAASQLFLADASGVKPLASFEELVGLDAMKAPVEFVEIKIMGKTVPVGVMLAYEMGLDKLIHMLGQNPRRVPAGKRVGLLPTEYALVFQDETLVFPKADRRAALILAGFQEYHKSLRAYSVYEFDKRGVYYNVLEGQGLSVRQLREIDLIYQMFIDPITRELLVEMKEPTTFQPLLLRAVDLLLSDQHPHELDPSHMRIKGYERMAGAVYSELVKTIRVHNGKAGKNRQPLDLNPFAVWIAIAEDPSKEQVSDINPIQNLKQQEAVTYSGTGGRSSRTMVKHTRAFHENDMGTISESTVDSGDVGINTYTSADPQFNSLRGISKRYKVGETGATALLSTSALLSVAADRDDPKRVNFIAIQQRHGVACKAYTPNAVRTGYEAVVAHRTGDLFAFTAKKPGKVVSVSPEGMVVEYDDGEKKGIELGRRFGNAAGLTIPHNVVTDMKAGQKFKAGTLLCHNDGFFQRDILNPDQVLWKAGVTVRVALMESTMTLEDSSAISRRCADWLQSKMTKVRNITVDFKQSVRKLVKVGEEVDSESILCMIEDATTANANLYDEESLDTLKMLSQQAPQAKAKGVVERIEIFYHGEKEDMSDTLRSLANASDREFAKRHTAVGKKAMSGQVNESFRIDGDPLNLDTMAIRIYITSDVPAGVGDKGVFGSQLKTVFGQVMENEVTTASGKVIDAIFGQKSINDRIVTSPDVIGTTTSLLIEFGRRAVEIYEKS